MTLYMLSDLVKETKNYKQLWRDLPWMCTSPAVLCRFDQLRV